MRVVTAAIAKSATRSALKDAGYAFVLAAAIVMLVPSGPVSSYLAIGRARSRKGSTRCRASP
jgi:hypothetical protein